MTAPPTVPDQHDDRLEANLDPDVARELHSMRVRDEARRLLAAERRAKVDPPEVLTLADRLARPPQPVLYRIDGWQPLGSRVVLAAQRKAGKTTLVGNLARALADGRRFLGVAECLPVDGRVAIVDFEMSATMLDRWLADQGVEDQDRVVVIPMRGRAATFDLRDESVLEEWALTLRAFAIEYLVIDCLRPWMDALALDEHREAGILLTALDSLLDRAGIGDALVVQHMGHDHERTRGDSRIRDWPEVEWRLVRENEDDTSPRYISAYGRDVDQGETKLHYEPATRHLTLAEGSRKDAAGLEALEAVLDVLAEGPLTGRGVERALSESVLERNAIRSALKLATRDGLLTTQPRKARGGGTEYVLSDQARQVRGSAPARFGSAPSASIGRALPTSPVDEKCAGEEIDL